MWKTLGLTLSSSATVSALEVIDWGSVADAQNSHKSQLAQLMTEIGQADTSTDYLYRFCVADFQLLVTEVKQIINQLEQLKKVTIPAQADEIWERRAIAEDVQSLDALKIEFQQAVEDGSFVLPPSVDISPALETENSELCSSLNEFDKIKRAIRAKHAELENQQAFSMWLEEQTQIPAVCEEKVAEFEEARENLESICAGAEEYKTLQLWELYDEVVRMDLTEPAITYQEFEEQILNAYGVTPFPNALRSPLIDEKPDSVPECEALTDPIGDEIDMLAADKKDIQDQIAFAPYYYCGVITSQLQEDTTEFGDKLDAKRAETEMEIQQLLLANPSLAANAAALNIILEAEFEQSEFFMAPTTNVVAFDNTPQSCSSNQNLNFALLQLRSVVAQLDRAENYCQFVKNQMSGACTAPFEDRIMSYMNQITGHTQQLNQIVEWLLQAYQELGYPITQKEFVANFRTKFQDAKDMGSFMSSFNDPITVPAVRPECQTAIDDGNYLAQLMEKAESTQDMFDFNVYLTDEVCAEIDMRLQEIITTNAVILDNSQADIQRALNDMFSFGDLTDRDGFYLFQRQLYDGLISRGELSFEDPGFSNPITMYPSSHCNNEYVWNLLNTVVSETTDSLTYEKWLEGRLDHQCDEGIPYFTERLNLLNGFMDVEMERKEQKLDQLFPILAPEQQTREEFESINRGMYETAKMNGEIVDNFNFPPLFNYPETCGPELAELEEEVIRKFDATKELFLCNAFTTEVLCSRLDQAILKCNDMNTIDARNYQTLVDQKLASLFPVTANDGEDFDTFKARMQSEFNAAIRHQYFVMEPIGDRCNLPEIVPSTCAQPGPNMVDFDNLNTLLSNLKLLANYERFLQERVATAVQTSLDLHLTVRALLWGEITQEEEKRLECLNDLYMDFDFAANGVTLEQFISEIELEFKMAQESETILNPAMVERDFPPVPAGLSPELEAQVAEERALIDQKATQLEGLKDFNNFVKDHVCSSRSQMYLEQCPIVEEFLTQTKDMKRNMLLSVFEAERADETEEFEQFCERLMDEFDAEFGEDYPEPSTPYTEVEYPVVIMPEDCEEAVAAQQSLIDKLDEVNKLLSLIDWVQPRITDNAMFLEQCREDEQDIQDAIKERFPDWTMCIATKINDLNTLFEQSQPNTQSFDDFILEVRAEFDELKDGNKIILSDAMFDLPEVHPNCPRSVQDQLVVGLAYRDVMQDCFSYRDWLQVQQTGVCEVSTYTDFYTNNFDLLTTQQDMRMMKLHDLFTLKVDAVNNGIMADRMAAMQVFEMQQMEQFSMDAPDESTVPISAAEIPNLCSPEARQAAERVQQLVQDLISATTFNDWLDTQLEVCCEELAMAYQGLVDLEMMADRLGNLQMQQDSLLDQLEVYKNTLGQTREAWGIDYLNSEIQERQIYPDETLDHALIDTPQSCLDLNAEANAAADTLFKIQLDIAKAMDVNEQLMENLMRCIEDTQNLLMMQQQQLLNDFFLLQQQVIAEQEALAAIQGITDLMQFQMDLRDQFNDALAMGTASLVEPQTPVTNLPPDADMLALMTLEQVKMGITDVQMEQSFLNWLKDMMQSQCQMFEMQIRGLIDPDELSELDAQIAGKQGNLYDLDPSSYTSLEDAIMTLGSQYSLAAPSLEMVPSGIVTPEPPTMCSSYTADDLQDLEIQKTNISNKKTECKWLDDLINVECQDDADMIDEIVSRSIRNLNSVTPANMECLETIASISSFTVDDLMNEFMAEYTLGIDNANTCLFFPDIQPACGNELAAEGSAAMDLCIELDRQVDLELFLGPKKSAACSEQQRSIIGKLSAISMLPGCPTLEDNWQTLYQCHGDGYNNLAVYQQDVLDNQFGPAYDSLTFPREDVGITDTTVADICPDLILLGEDLTTQLEQAIELASLCVWLENQVVDSCAAKKTMLDQLFTENEPELASAKTESERQLHNLFLLSSSSSLDRFTEDMYDSYSAQGRSLSGIDIGFTIPSIPDMCRDVTDESYSNLLKLVQSLRVEKDFAAWLQMELTASCEGSVTNELNTLSDNIMTELTQCQDVDVPAIQDDLYSFQDSSVVNAGQFRSDLNTEFDTLYSNNQIMGAETPFNVPLTPDVCLQDPNIDMLVMDITNNERALSACLAEKMWLEDMLAEQCVPKAEQLERDKLTFGVQLDIVEFQKDVKIDDLTICEGRQAEGTMIVEAEMRILFRDRLNPQDTPVGETDLPEVSGNMGCSSLQPVLDELAATRQMIIDEGTFNNFLDTQLDACTTTNLAQLADETAALEAMFPDLATYTCPLAPLDPLSFKNTLGLPLETDEQFLARMISERVDAASAYPLGNELFGTNPVNPLPPSTATSNQRAVESAYMAALAELRAEADLCGDDSRWLRDQEDAACQELSDNLSTQTQLLGQAQDALTTEINNKLQTLQGLLGDASDLDDFKANQKQAMNDAGAPSVPPHEFMPIQDNFDCFIFTSGYNSDVSMYEMDLQLRMYIEDKLIEECNDLDINMERVQVLTLLAQVNAKNDALEELIQTAVGSMQSIDQILMSQGLSIDSVIGAQTADVDLTKYDICQKDSTDLANDVAMVNEAYRRCKMLTDSLMMALTQTIVDLANARDANIITQDQYDGPRDEIVSQLFILSGESDYDAFYDQLEMDLIITGRITMLAQTSSSTSSQISADLEQGGIEGQIEDTNDLLLRVQLNLQRLRNLMDILRLVRPVDPVNPPEPVCELSATQLEADIAAIQMDRDEVDAKTDDVMATLAQFYGWSAIDIENILRNFFEAVERFGYIPEVVELSWQVVVADNGCDQNVQSLASQRNQLLAQLQFESNRCNKFENDLIDSCRQFTDQYSVISGQLQIALDNCESSLENAVQALFGIDNLNQGFTLNQFRDNLDMCFSRARAFQPLQGTCASYDPTFEESQISTQVNSSPDRCNLYISDLRDSETQLRTLAFRLKDCKTEESWVLNQLGEEACPTLDQYLPVQSEIETQIAFEQSQVQAPILADLFQFKGISEDNGDVNQMRQRMFNQIFPAEDTDPLLLPLDPPIAVPEVPFYCPDIAFNSKAETDQLIIDLQKEKTFTLFIETALEECCESLKEDTQATITAATERSSALQGEINAAIQDLISLGGQTEMYWVGQLADAALDPPALGASEYPVHDFAPLTCETETQVLVSVTLPSLAAQIEQQKIDLAFYQSEAARLCSEIEDGVSVVDYTTSTGLSLTPENCASVRSGLMDRVGASNSALAGLTLEQLRAETTAIINYLPDVDLGIPTLSSEALAACSGDGISASLAVSEAFEQCINDVEDFDLYLTTRCGFLTQAIILDASQIDTTNSDSTLMANQIFMDYTMLTGDMDFEATRTMGLLEEGCAVMAVTPETYDYCGSLAGDMNLRAMNLASSQDRINQNNMLMTCLEDIVTERASELANQQCNAEVDSYINTAVLPEEIGGSVQVAIEGAMDGQLQAWIAIAGAGEATALEAQLRATQCFMDDASLDAAVMMTHPATTAMISSECLSADGASDAIMRYNDAFAMVDADARLAEWISGKLETVRAQRCDSELVTMENELLSWRMTVLGLMDYQNMLYDEFFSSLTSTAEDTSAAFFAACDIDFEMMVTVASLPIPGPAADAVPCDAYQEMTDVRDELMGLQTSASTAEAKKMFYDQKVEEQCEDLALKQMQEQTDLQNCMSTQEGLAAAAYALDQAICARQSDSVPTHECAVSQESFVADVMMGWTLAFEPGSSAVPAAVNNFWRDDVSISSRAEAITFDDSWCESVNGFSGDSFLSTREQNYICQAENQLLEDVANWQCAEVDVMLRYEKALWYPIDVICQIELDVRLMEWWNFDTLNGETTQTYDEWLVGAMAGYDALTDEQKAVKSLEQIHESGYSMHIVDPLTCTGDLLTTRDELVAMQTSIPQCDSQRAYAQAQAELAMGVLTDDLDDITKYPDEMIDAVDPVTGEPKQGGFGLNCVAIENGEFGATCETSDPPFNGFEDCVFCGGGVEIPNRARQMIIDQWCAADAEMLNLVNPKIAGFLTELDDTTLALFNWLSDDTDMAALTNFGQTFSEEVITQEDLNTQNLLRPYQLTDLVFDQPWSTSILRDQQTYMCTEDEQALFTSVQLAQSLPDNTLALYQQYQRIIRIEQWGAVKCSRAIDVLDQCTQTLTPDIQAAIDVNLAIFSQIDAQATSEEFMKKALQSFNEDDTFTCTANTVAACSAAITEQQMDIQEGFCGFVYRERLEREKLIDQQIDNNKDDACFAQWLSAGQSTQPFTKSELCMRLDYLSIKQHQEMQDVLRGLNLQLEQLERGAYLMDQTSTCQYNNEDEVMFVSGLLQPTGFVEIQEPSECDGSFTVLSPTFDVLNGQIAEASGKIATALG